VARIDLNRRVAVLRVAEEVTPTFPHALRGSLAAMTSEAGWHVVVAFQHDVPYRPEVTGVIDQARKWAADTGCRLSVTTVGAIQDVLADER
jgi:hypothetical protein